ncbi:hypothetical protein G5B30_05730 [Sphingobacterium sp. SGG-5]|uniref:DUF6695 family protein n=1 Tax=Sphingobacterium sp. SGG-5 TaxID=2710881 RepID=UPI0013EC9913|nr:DUF6695 family protein [Sphingobacterium sp. SGG-5]NGM61417.1 hypothetical protein [Sphingobacterium sp. SGG-5]
MELYNDIALPLAWPDQTAYGDEAWMSLLQKCGIVKDLHFKVGHAAILLIERKTGEIRYFDFGRYICPRGYGRARSQDFDPRLRISIRADIDPATGEITNLLDILQELSGMETATHGGGRLLFVPVQGISFKKAVDYAENIVRQGPILYGALAANNNSCSRYVAQALTHAMDPKDFRIRKILYPECVKASPTSNIVNASPDGYIYCYEQRILSQWKMGRWASLRFQWNLIRENLRTKKTPLSSPTDGKHTVGYLGEPVRPSGLPAKAQWLGGIGEGVWLYAEHNAENMTVSCYSTAGEVLYQTRAKCPQDFDRDKSYAFTPDFSCKHFTILQHGNTYVFKQLDLTGEIEASIPPAQYLNNS